MIEQDIQKKMKERYQKINAQWMLVHFKLLVLWTVVAGAAEVVMYFIISKSDTLVCSANEYWFKYIFTPIGLNICIIAIGYVVLKNIKILITVKQCVISFLFVLLGFVLSLMHSGFIAVLVAAIFPILLTIMYENQKLTLNMTIISMVMQFISGYFVLWDPDKVVDSPYLINLIILQMATFFTWFACGFMIRFMKMKREIVISNDIERHYLQRKVNIDGLTGIGNKLALMELLEKETEESDPVHYFVMLDVDSFKKINDTYGHMFGDDVLKCLGEGLRTLEIDENSYRYGGDEFCILFTKKSLEIVMEKLIGLQNYLTENIKIPDDQMKISVSMGICCYAKGKSKMDLMQQADNALYEAKKQRGNNKILVSKE